MHRHDAALVLEVEEARPAHRGLDLCAVVERGVPIAYGGMETPDPSRRVVAERVADLRPLEISGEVACFAYFERQFDQRLDSLADLRR